MPEETEAKIIRELAELTGLVRTELNHLTELVRRHDEFLFGTDQRDGLVVRTDRLEQHEERRTFHIRALWSAVVGGVLTAVGTAVIWIIKRFSEPGLG